MHDSDVLILRGDEIAALLEGKEAEVVDAVRRAYLVHASGESSLPHSTFLRFPGDDLNRIIALPAFLGDGFGTAGLAGMKWIASFPGNVPQGMARASAVLILNSAATGRPEAILESSLISARRTAASAALAAQVLRQGQETTAAGLIGTGVINFETARFLAHTVPSLSRFALYDLDRERAEDFARRVRGLLPGREVEVAEDPRDLYRSCPLVVFATTAVRPHVSDLSDCLPGATVLHTSLRDLTADAILSADNVVDDVDHVLRAQTSVHLAEQQAGHRGFLRCTLADLLAGTAPPKTDERAVSVFSPFGLGVLDLAVGDLVRRLALEAGKGTVIESFLPAGD